MITPGDITKGLLEQADDQLRANGISAFPSGEELAAAILNAAIEAGLVSPPVWAFRYHYNSDIAHDSKGTLLFDSLENAEKFGETKSDGASGDAIHWKGERYEE
jgi:hypothetical protein